jgi:hypothetical protein
MRLKTRLLEGKEQWKLVIWNARVYFLMGKVFLLLSFWSFRNDIGELSLTPDAALDLFPDLLLRCNVNIHFHIIYACCSAVGSSHTADASRLKNYRPTAYTQSVP